MKKMNAVARTPQQVLNELIKEQSNGGEITLDAFARKAGIDRIEAMNFLQTANGGCFVIGRRGHKSRFLHGEAFDKFRHQEEIRREWRKKQGLPPNALPTLNGRRTVARRGRPITRKPAAVTPSPVVTTVEATKTGEHLNVGSFSLQVDINGQKATLPLTVELVPAE
jgi:hypothetical protein